MTNIRKYIYSRILLFSAMVLWFGYAPSHAAQRIITLNSSITETVYGLGLGSSVVATDVTSISPAAAAKLPKVCKNRSVSAEGLLSFSPTIVLAIDGEVPAAVIQHVRSSGVTFVSFKQEFSSKGALRFIQEIADALQVSESGKRLVEQTSLALDNVAKVIADDAKSGFKPKVLFIYARGTGTMSVAGKGSSLDGMIRLAGGKNAIQEFSDFKPYTTEALVAANPDIILLFDFGASSLGGVDAILKMPGVRLTTAGKSRRILVMNASMLVNFSNRLPESIIELHKGMKEMMNLGPQD